MITVIVQTVFYFAKLSFVCRVGFRRS